MRKLFHTIRFFFVYRRNVLKNREYLSARYGLNIDSVYRLWTTITLADAPPEVKEKYGKALAETQIKKYIATFNADLIKLELDELVNLYEIVPVDSDNYGITFGYSQMRNEKFIATGIGVIVALIAIAITLLIIL